MRTPPVRVSEIFGPTLQGEGMLAGEPTVFIRTGGCDCRCRWCDTFHAVDPAFRHEWQPMQAEEILARVNGLSGGTPCLLTLSGGNPALQPLEELIRAGKQQGYRFAMETQGTVARTWFRELDVLTLSPKPPSSGCRTDPERIGPCLRAAGENGHRLLKLVVFDDDDYLYARETGRRYPGIPLYLQPGNPDFPTASLPEPPVRPDDMARRLRWLAERVLRDRWMEVRVLPQLHLLIWGSARGV